MPSSTSAVPTTAATVKASATAAVEAAAHMTDPAATVVELGMMAFVVMTFPIMVNVEVGIVAPVAPI